MYGPLTRCVIRVAMHTASAHFRIVLPPQVPSAHGQLRLFTLRTNPISHRAEAAI
jgi:hypothetical protein